MARDASPPPSSTGDDLQNGGSARLVGGGGTGVNPPRGIHHRRAEGGRNADKTLYYCCIAYLYFRNGSQQQLEKWPKIGFVDISDTLPRRLDEKSWRPSHVLD